MTFNDEHKSIGQFTHDVDKSFGFSGDATS
jgi:hypothetical protein